MLKKLAIPLFLGLWLLIGIPSAKTAPTVSKETKGIWEKVYSSYKNGAYNQALAQLEEIKKIPALQATALYWQGLCYNRLQDFDDAINAFKQALKKGIKPSDIYYEFGQALYARQDLELARTAFIASVKNGYQVPASNYYIGIISKMLEEYPFAIDSFKKILQAPPDLSQPAHFQIAEILLERALLTPDPVLQIKNLILPQLQIAMDKDPQSSLAQEIKEKRKELLKKYDLDPDLMLSGRQLPEKKFSIAFEENISYDSNVISEPERSTAKALKKGSIINQARLSADYIWAYQRRYTLVPSFKVADTHHFEQEHEKIFKNDSRTLNPSLLGSYEHRAWEQKASLQLEADYLLQFKDYRENHTFPTYGKTWSFSLGEKFQYWNVGETSVKMSRKDLLSYDSNQHSLTHSLMATQQWMLASKDIFLLVFNLDLTDMINNKVESFDMLMIRTDYIIPQIWTRTKLLTALTMIFTDPKSARPVRGIESSFSPSLGLEWNWSEKITLRLKYDYTQKDSDDKVNFSYKKHDCSLRLKASF